MSMTSATPKPRAGEHTMSNEADAVVADLKQLPDNHTPGPWRFVQEDNAIVGADGFLISDCVPRSADFGMKERDANARRIVACVNYCEGIATSFLEGASIGQPVFPEAERDLLRERERELIEALASIDRLMMAMPLTSKIEHQVHGIAHRALAKVRP